MHEVIKKCVCLLVNGSTSLKLDGSCSGQDNLLFPQHSYAKTDECCVGSGAADEALRSSCVYQKKS